MLRTLMIAAAAAIALSTAAASAGGLQSLAQGGPAPGQLHGLWSSTPNQHEYQPAQGVRCVFRVRFYKQTWQHKKYRTFATFRQAKLFMLQAKMQGYLANLSIHELHPRPQAVDAWLPQ